MKHCFGNVQYDLQYIINILLMCHRLATFINTCKQELVAYATDSISPQVRHVTRLTTSWSVIPCGVTHRKCA